MQVVETQLLSLNEMAEAWAGDPVRSACDAEELAGTALALWRVFQARLAQKPGRGRYDESAEVSLANDNFATVRRFAHLFALFASAEQRLHAAGQRLVAAGELAEASAQAAELLSHPPESVIRGHQQARAGQGRSAAEVRRDLLRRLHA